MGYNLQEPQSFINVKLTDVGRRQLSMGQLNFASCLFSDKEINYSIDRLNRYIPTSNRILSPVDQEPSLSLNFDGTNPQLLLSKFVTSAKQFSTAHTETYGFFSSITDSFFIDSTKILGADKFLYSANTYGGKQVVFGGVLNTPTVGNFVRIGWSSPNYTTNLQYTGNISEYSATPLNYLFYRIVSGSPASNTYLLDRDIPNFSGYFSSGSTSGKSTNVIFYPSQSVENFYGSGATVDPKLWNFNITRTSSNPGTTEGISGYTSYGSLEFNGTKQYLGFSAETPVFGVLHYTNAYTGNTYAEALIEGTVEIDIPYIMWWNTEGNNGEVMTQGLTLYDVYGDTVKDTLAGTTYRLLRDGIGSTSRAVGRVYHKLKIMIIDDQELLTSLSYKSNRNWTLPDYSLTLVQSPKFPLSPSQASGMCETGFTYFVTYLTESSAYSSNVSYGFGNGLHCGYIKKIDGAADVNGNPQFLSLSFPSNSFPFLRSSSSMSGASISGTGWNTNKVQVLVNKQSKDFDYQIGNVPEEDWIRVSNVVGNGIYTGDSTDLSINPLKLAGYSFIMSVEDYNSGTTYTLGKIFTGETDFNSATGMTFGNESFFYGNINSDIMAVTYKTLITATASNNDFNDSLNSSYDPLYDENTYITEVAVLDSNNNLVAVGKPSYPITKNDGRYIVIQLEMDF